MGFRQLDTYRTSSVVGTVAGTGMGWNAPSQNLVPDESVVTNITTFGRTCRVSVWVGARFRTATGRFRQVRIVGGTVRISVFGNVVRVLDGLKQEHLLFTTGTRGCNRGNAVVYTVDININFYVLTDEKNDPPVVDLGLPLIETGLR